MKHLAVLLLLLTPLPATAQNVIASYNATLNVQDMHNSRGTRLTDVCQVVQQDRANFHRFGRSDPDDGYDPVFGNREARSRISASCVVTDSQDWIRDGIRYGEPRWIRVQVLGSGGYVSQVLVGSGPG